MTQVLVGYGRCSAVDQSLEIQEATLRRAGCTKLFLEKKSGIDANRPALKEALSFVREGDVLVICRLDRLARSLLHLTQILQDLERKHVNLRVLDNGIDTSTPHGKLFYNVTGAFAEFERCLLRERQALGIAHAKANKVKFGRPAALSPEDRERFITARRDEKLTPRELAQRFKISIPTVYRQLQSQASR